MGNRVHWHSIPVHGWWWASPCSGAFICGCAGRQESNPDMDTEIQSKEKRDLLGNSLSQHESRKFKSSSLLAQEPLGLDLQSMPPQNKVLAMNANISCRCALHLFFPSAARGRVRGEEFAKLRASGKEGILSRPSASPFRVGPGLSGSSFFLPPLSNATMLLPALLFGRYFSRGKNSCFMGTDKIFTFIFSTDRLNTLGTYFFHVVALLFR